MQMIFHLRNRFCYAACARGRLLSAVAFLLAFAAPVLGAEPNQPNGNFQLDDQSVLTEKAVRSLIIPQMLPDSQIDVIIADVCEHIGLACNFDVFPARVPNAMAYMIDGKRVVMYSPDFIDKLQRGKEQPSWATLSVLVHEVGHHLLGHMFVMDGDFPARELEADRFSAFMLYRMGATLNEAQANIRTMAQENETASHPGRSRRLVAIEQGWVAGRTVANEEKELAAKRAEHSIK